MVTRTLDDHAAMPDARHEFIARLRTLDSSQTSCSIAPIYNCLLFSMQHRTPPYTSSWLSSSFPLEWQCIATLLFPPPVRVQCPEHMTLRIWTTKRRMANHGQATVVNASLVCSTVELMAYLTSSSIVFVIEFVQSFLSLALTLQVQGHLYWLLLPSVCTLPLSLPSERGTR